MTYVARIRQYARFVTRNGAVIQDTEVYLRSLAEGALRRAIAERGSHAWRPLQQVQLAATALSDIGAIDAAIADSIVVDLEVALAARRRVGQHREFWGSYNVAGASGRLDLPSPVPARLRWLTATVAAAWASREVSAATDLKLTMALQSRFAPVAAAWLGIDPDLVQVSWPTGPGWGECERAGSGLRAALPLSWLASVWAAGLSEVDGRLVDGVTEVNGPRATVLAVRRPGDGPESLTVARRAGKWTVTP
jgi:hypothetical protein